MGLARASRLPLLAALISTFSSCFWPEPQLELSEIARYLPLGYFIVAGSSPRTSFTNHDVDSIVFDYSTTVSSTAFWAKVTENTTTSRWLPYRNGASFREYKMGAQVCTDVVRVGYAEPTSRVVVGYVQLTDLASERPKRPTCETTFTQEDVWPVFDKRFRRHSEP